MFYDKCSKCDQVDYILSSLKPQSKQLKLENSILLKSQTPPTPSQTLTLQHPATLQPPATLQALVTRLNSLKAQEISAQQIDLAQQQEALLAAQESLKSQENRLKNLEAERLRQIDLDQA